MPLVRPYALGGASAMSPPCNLRRRIVLVGLAPVATTPLLVEGLPHLFLWASQTTIGGVATMEWQWSARSITAQGAPADDWQLLFPAATTLLVAGSPVYYERAAFSAKRIRLRLTATAVPTTIEIFYGATL